MAQLDTGLGWSAKDSWLMQGTGVIGRILGGLNWNISGFETQQIPVTAPTSIDIIAGGLQYRTYKAGRPGSLATYAAYLSANKPGAIAAYFHDVGSSPFRLIVYVPDQSFVIYYQSQENGSPQGTPVVLTMEQTTIGTETVYYCYNQGSASYSAGTFECEIPMFTYNSDRVTCVQTGWPYVVRSADIELTKDNPGYAVACVAKWRTSAGVTIETPILISSDSSFSEMTASSQLYFAKYRDRRDGMTFYMGFFQNVSGAVVSSLPRYDISSPEEPYANLDEIFNLLCAPDQANVLVTEPVDPYDEFPNTGEDAGEVDPNPEDDDIEETDLPTMSFATAGFCRIYRPSFSQVSALASYMWTDQSFLQTVINHLKQILENPIDAIISLSIVPCVPDVLSDEEVKVMYVPTGVYMPPVQRQFVSVDCGTYTLTEMYGSALDYNPYTSVQLYLPYIGIVQLDTDEVMGKTISIGYRIDVVTGVCCAYVKANNDVLYQFSGHCSIHQPITSADFSGYINAALAAGKLVASIAAAGAGAPAVAATLAGAPTPSISGTESKTVETERNPNTGRQITVGTRRQESQTYNPGASFGEVATRGVSNTVGAVMNSKTIVQHSGGFSGNSGFLAAVRRPYLIVTRPRIANPENYGKYNGRPSMIYLNLGECTGFTQVQSIQLTGIDATNPELSEIATLLNSGVIL